MSLLKPRRESRALTYQQVWGTGGDWNDYRTQRALAHTAVYACARLIASTVARMPIDVYRRNPDGTSSPAAVPGIFRIPCRQETPFEWKYRAVASLVLRGEAFGLPYGSSTGGFPAQLHWLDPNLVTVNDSQYPDLAPDYYYRARHLTASDIVHMSAFCEPGSVRGLSPIAVFRRTFDAGLSAKEYGLRWFDGGGQPSGILQSDLNLTDQQANTAKVRWDEHRQGGGIAVIGSGAKYQPIQLAPEESQFLAAQRYSVTEVARIFGVPPEMIGGDSGNSKSYSNREQNNLDFINITLVPYMAALEEHLTRLIPAPLFVRLNTDDLLRADLKSQLEAFAVGISSHQITPAEARAARDLPPLTPEQQAELQAVPIITSPQGKPTSAVSKTTSEDDEEVQ